MAKTNHKLNARIASIPAEFKPGVHLIMGCAPRSALHLRFPIEKKKNFSFTRDLFYRLLGH